MDQPRGAKLCAFKAGEGTGSSRSPAHCSASPTHDAISIEVMPAFSDCGYIGTTFPVHSPSMTSTEGFDIWRWPRKVVTLPDIAMSIPSRK
jgi:hypothetical protein